MKVLDEAELLDEKIQAAVAELTAGLAENGISVEHSDDQALMLNILRRHWRLQAVKP